MIKLIIKNPDGSQFTQEITQNTTLKPTAGQQFYFDNVDGKEYTFNLTDGEESIELIFVGDGERLVFNLEGMAELIKESDNILDEKMKTVLGIMDDQDGMNELEATALNPNFEGDNIISELKDLLADTTNPDENYQNGIIIDDFGSLAEALDAAAAGDGPGQNSGFTNDIVDPSGGVFGADPRGRGNTFDIEDPSGEVDGDEIDFNPLLIVGDAGVVYEVGLTSTSDDSEFYNGSFDIESPDGISTVTVGGVTFTLAELIATNTTPSAAINVGEGEVRITGFTEVSSFESTVTFEYKLLTSQNHDGELDDGDATNNSANTLPTSPIPISVTDIDGDTASGELNINIIDDTPEASLLESEYELSPAVLDESDLSADGIYSATVNIVSIFGGTSSIDYGADGAGSTTYTLTLNSQNEGSGLFILDPNNTTAGEIGKGEEIELVTINGVVTGIVPSTNDTVFTIEIDSQTGELTFAYTDQNPDNIWNGNTNSDDDAEVLKTATEDTLVVTQTIVDADGDSVTSEGLDVADGTFFKIEDDGPSAGLVEGMVKEAQYGEVSLTVDESADRQTPFADTVADKKSSADFSMMFSTVTVNNVETQDYGTDGPGSTEYALSLTNAQGVTQTDIGSGLYALGVDGNRGAEIVMNYDSSTGNIVGTVGSTVYFTISNTDSQGVKSANVTFTQLENIFHNDSTDHNDADSIEIDAEIYSGVSINLTQTVTDADGDSDSASIALVSSNEQEDVAKFTILDDGPDAGLNAEVVSAKQESEIALRVDESANVQSGETTDRVAKADFVTLFKTEGQNGVTATDVYGTDGAGSTTYALSLSSAATIPAAGIGSGIFALGLNGAQGAEIMLSEDNGSIVGKVGSTVYFTISNSGTEVTFTQSSENIYHPDGMDHNDAVSISLDNIGNDAVSINLVQTVVDADGDTDTAEVALVSSVDSEDVGQFTILDDGPSAGLSATATTSLVNENNIVLNVDESAGVNAPADDNGDRSSKADFSVMFSTVTVGSTTSADFGTDGAGSVSYALSLNGGIGKLTYLASGLYALDANDTVTNDNDGLGQGEEIIMTVNASGVIEGKTTDGTVYFTIEADDNGVVTFTQTNNIWHSDATDHNDMDGIALSKFNNLDVSIDLTQTVTDADGDIASAAVKLVSSDDSADVAQFNILDDGPDAKLTGEVATAQNNDNNIALTVDESPVPTNGDGKVSATADFTKMFLATTVTGFANPDYGTDGAGSVDYSLSLVNITTASTLTTLKSGLYALDSDDTGTSDHDAIGQGEEIIMSVNATTGNIEGKTSNGDIYFTISNNGASVTFTQVKNIWHPSAGDDSNGEHDDAASIALAKLSEGTEDVSIVLTQTITDADGDIDSASISLVSSKDTEDVAKFTIEDDGPTAATPDASLLENNQFTITNHDEVSSAGYHNSYGYYLKDPVTGEPTTGVIVWDDVHDKDTTPVTVTGYTKDQVGFFIIPNGENKNSNVEDNTEVTFNQLPNGEWQAVITSSGEAIKGQGSHVIFDNGDLNKDTQDHVVDNSLIGNQNWEDLQIPRGDGDFNDVNINVEWSNSGVLDESELPTSGDGIYSATVDVSAAFSASAAGDYGTDGAGSKAYAVELNLTPQVRTVGSGLFILDNTKPDGKGDEIILVDNADGTVSGMDGTSKVFTISIDALGVVTIAYENQVDPVNIWHPNTGDSDDAAVLKTTVAGTLVVTQTITDADGDTAKSDGLDLGNGKFFRIEDDGPVVGLEDAEVRKAQVNNIELTVDETAGQQANPADNLGASKSSADFISLFKVDSTSTSGVEGNYGTDGAGSTSYSLSLENATGQSLSDIGSGLFAIGPNGTKGTEILLNEVNGEIVGSANGVTYFTISNVDAEVTFEQNENIWHSQGGDKHNDSESISLENLNGKYVSILLTQTVTDADGDSADSSISLVSSNNTLDVGKFNILDDGPAVDVNALNGELLLEESFELGDNSWSIQRGNWDVNGENQTSVTGDHGAVWTFNNNAGVEIQSDPTLRGVDADDGDTYAELDPHDRAESNNTSMTTNVTLTTSEIYSLTFAYQPRPGSKDSSDMKVTFGGKELTIDSDSSGNLTITPDDGSVTYTTDSSTGWTTFTVVYTGVTGTDADLTFEGLNTPSENGANTLGALIDDIKLVSGLLEPTLVVDETDLTVDATADFSALFSATKDAGTDGEKSYVTEYSLDVKSEDVDSGLVDTASNQAVLLKVVSGDVVGYVTISGVETTVFTVSVDSNGVIELDQERAMVHPDATDHDDAISLIADDLVTLTRKDTITDNDGDTATDSESIDIGQNLTFKDDGPSIDVKATKESTVTLTTQDADTDGAASDTDVTTADFSGVFAISSSTHGADGAGTIDSDNYALSVKNSNSGLTSGGVAITLSLVNGEVVGKAGTVEVFKVSTTSSGVVTLTQYEAIDHPNTNSDSEIISLVNGKIKLTADVTITDKDGDTASDKATIDLGGNLRFQDDGPSVSLDNTVSVKTLTVDESPLNEDGKLSASADYAANFGTTVDYGADGAGSVSYDLTLTGTNVDSGLTNLTGDSILMSVNSTTGAIEGKVGNEVYFTITNNGSQVTFTQLENIAHDVDGDNSNGEHDDAATLNAVAKSILLTKTVTDGDGDSDTADLDLSQNVFKIEDDGPSAINEVKQLECAEEVPTNLIFTLDVSGSMAKDEWGGYLDTDGDGNKDTTRFELAIQSIKDTISEYAADGTTKVNFTLFNTGALNITDMTPDEAMAYLDRLSMTPADPMIKLDGQGINGLDEFKTDFDDALEATMLINLPSKASENNVVYFISDGKPTKDNRELVNEETDARIVEWDAHVSANVDQLHVVGMGTGIDATAQNYLDIVQVQDGKSAMVVTDATQLSQTLVSTVNAVEVNGSLLDNVDFGTDGAGEIVSIEIDGTVYTKDGSNGTTAIPVAGVTTVEGGVFKYDFVKDEYSYTIDPKNSTDGIIDEDFAVVAKDADGDTTQFMMTIDGEKCIINTPPEADPVRTTSNLDTDDAVMGDFATAIGITAATPLEDQIAFFKKIDIGSGLDGDLTVRENDSSDPADLGGKDKETTENNLEFDITTLPNYGKLYIQVGNTVTELDASNLDADSTILSTADTVYWAATHKEVPAEAEKSIGGVYDTKANMEAAWTSADIDVIARDGHNRDADVSYSTTNGIGVTGNTGGPSEQLGYDADANRAESIIFDFKKPVTDAEIDITHLIKGESGGEIGTFEAFLDGNSLGTFTFSNKDGVADYHLVAEAHGSGNTADANSGTLVIDNLVFDQIRFSAQEYANQDGQVNDSSDYFIGGITYHEVPGVEFEYQVIDADGKDSGSHLTYTETPVIIDVCTDTPIPPSTNDPVPTSESESKSLDVCLSDTNLVITLDVSGSMTDDTHGGMIDTDGDGTKDTTRLQLAKEAIVNMIESYSNNGTVNVQLTTFGVVSGTTSWMSATDAIAHINSINAVEDATAGTNTNYEAAIDSTVDNFTDINPSAKTVAYFISDGVPTIEMKDSTTNSSDTASNDGIDGTTSGTYKIDTVYASKWENFVNSEVNSLHVVGIGPDVANSEYLDVMAVGSYDAEYTSDLAIDSTLGGGIDSVSGNLYDNVTWGTNVDGSKDVGSITSIEIDGTVYTSSSFPNGGVEVKNDSNEVIGKLEFNFANGDYTYTNLEDDPTKDYTEVMDLVATDSTGDKTEYKLTIDVKLGKCVIDTVPVSYDETNTMTFADTTTNITFIVDVSSSMSNTDIDLSEDAIDNIIAQYNALGDTNVQVIQFARNFNENTGWQDGSNLTVDGTLYKNKAGTDPEQGMSEAMASYNKSDLPAADQNVIYYFGDGNPYNNSNDSFLTDYNNVLSDWHTFLNDKIDQIKAFGINVDKLDMLDSDTSGSIDTILPVGNSPIYADNSNAANDIVDAVSGTAELTINGDVLENISGGDGAISIDSIEVYGQTYTSSNFPSSGIELDGDGSFKFNFTTGEYSFTGNKSEFSADESKTFKVNASDVDGDTTSLDVTIDIDVTPLATENIVDLADTDTIDLATALTSHSTTEVDGVDMTDGKSNTLNIDLDDIITLDDDPELDELKIFGENGDKVTLEGGKDNWSNQGKEEIDGETFNVYQGTNGNSNIKVLIDEDVSIDPDL